MERFVVVVVDVPGGEIPALEFSLSSSIRSLPKAWKMVDRTRPDTTAMPMVIPGQAGELRLGG